MPSRELPIVIPAKNAAEHLPTTLSALSRIGSEVIVVVNGTSDNSAEISEAAGATVLESAPGKMPAIQTALQYLGDRALEPLVILDADTYPRSPNLWAKAAYKHLASGEGRAAIYPYWFVKSGVINGVLRSAHQLRTMTEHPYDRTTPVGHSMGIRLTPAALDDFFAIENFWPGEDKAMVRIAQKHGIRTERPTESKQILNTPFPHPTLTLAKRLMHGKDWATKTSHDLYVQRGPVGSMPYDDFDFSRKHGLSEAQILDLSIVGNTLVVQ
jgi:glycosyltransferase involved in cell wall biosynthesis